LIIDYRAQAERAMRMAVATTGFDRARWVRIAVASHELEKAGGQLALNHERASSRKKPIVILIATNVYPCELERSKYAGIVQ
jgi:hypothetical protein